MEIFRVVVGGYRVILITVLAAVTAGVVSLILLPATYESTSMVYVRPVLSSSGTKAAAFQAQNYANYRTITYKELATTDLILEPVIRDLDLGVSPRELSRSVTALAALDTTIIEIIVSWDDPEAAALVANRIAEQMTTELSETQSTLAISLELSQVQEAVIAAEPSSPRPRLVLGLCTVAGLLAGCSAVLFRHSWRAIPESRPRTEP